jgi:hypothetical protein
VAPVGHCRDRGGITHAPRPCSWPDTTAALDSESAVRSATGGPGACHSCAAQARGPRLLGAWGPLSWASESSFVTVLRPFFTGPARPRAGSLARCGEHATAAGPGSVIQVALDQPQAGPRPLRLRSCDGTPLAPLRLQASGLRGRARWLVHLLVRRAAALACPSTSGHWQHDLCLMPWWHSGSGS